MTEPLERLRAATITNGAPSARNLLVTVFGDALLPHDTSVSVASLARLLEPFAVSERLVRTSLSRLVNDGLLTTQTVGRRSFYGVHPDSVPLFRQADGRIYGMRRPAWDGWWTIVVIDGAEATAAERAQLRQRLTWAGLGSVGPNVMASPVVTADEAASVVEQVGGFDHVLVGRSQLVTGSGTIGEEELAGRCAPLDEVAAGYDDFVRAFGDIDRAMLDALDPAEAFKLRTLLVAVYRRIVLIDPLLPESLLPDGWAGVRAREVAAFVYGGCADASERHLAATAEQPDGSIVPDPTWLHGRFHVG